MLRTGLMTLRRTLLLDSNDSPSQDALVLRERRLHLKGAQVATLKEIAKMLTGCKRKRKGLELHSSKSTCSKDWSWTSTETSSGDSSSSSYSTGSSTSSSTSFSSSSDGTSYDSGVDSGSEYYYSTSENPRSELYDTESTYATSCESSWGANTQKGFSSGAPISQTRAGHRSPVRQLKILGEGSFAVVYLSYSKSSKQYFAVKCAKPFRRGALKSLTREAAILKQLNSPYIIEYLGERTTVPTVTIKASTGAPRGKGVPMVSEIHLPYMKRGTLADEIRACRKKKQVMKESVIKNYTKQILSGLSYIHSKNIVHCDLKGSNILMGDTTLKISDFGVSKRLTNPSSNKRGTRAGTKAWMAPEAHLRIEQGFPADVWSLGCTVVQMITGKPPRTTELKSFLSPDTTAEQTQSQVIPKDFQRLSSECIDFLRKSFLKDTKARWTCKQLLDHPFLIFTDN